MLLDKASEMFLYEALLSCKSESTLSGRATFGVWESEASALAIMRGAWLVVIVLDTWGGRVA